MDRRTFLRLPVLATLALAADTKVQDLSDLFPGDLPGAAKVMYYPHARAQNTIVHVMDHHPIPDLTINDLTLPEYLATQQGIYKIIQYLHQQRGVSEIYMEGMLQNDADKRNALFHNDLNWKKTNQFMQGYLKKKASLISKYRSGEDITQELWETELNFFSVAIPFLQKGAREFNYYQSFTPATNKHLNEGNVKFLPGSKTKMSDHLSQDGMEWVTAINAITTEEYLEVNRVRVREAVSIMGSEKKRILVTVWGGDDEFPKLVEEWNQSNEPLSLVQIQPTGYSPTLNVDSYVDNYRKLHTSIRDKIKSSR